jgi:predicted Zn-dependent protease
MAGSAAAMVLGMASHHHLLAALKSLLPLLLAPGAAALWALDKHFGTLIPGVHMGMTGVPMLAYIFFMDAAVGIISLMTENHGKARTDQAGKQIMAEAKAAVEQRDFGGALVVLENGIREIPDDPFLRNRYASILLKLHRTEEAVAAARECVERFPGDVVARTTLANALMQAGQAKEAVETARECVERFPGDVVARNTLANALMQAGQAKEAVAAAHECVRRFPGDVVARNTLANALLQAGQAKEAVAAARECVERFPGDVVARNTLANALLQAGRAKEAVAAARECVERFPGDVVARTTLIKCLLKVRNYGAALTTAEEAVTQFPENVVAQGYLAAAYKVTGRHSDANALAASLTEKVVPPEVADELAAYFMGELPELSDEDDGNTDNSGKYALKSLLPLLLAPGAAALWALDKHFGTLIPGVHMGMTGTGSPCFRDFSCGGTFLSALSVLACHALADVKPASRQPSKWIRLLSISA